MSATLTPRQPIQTLHKLPQDEHGGQTASLQQEAERRLQSSRQQAEPGSTAAMFHNGHQWVIVNNRSSASSNACLFDLWCLVVRDVECRWLARTLGLRV